MSLRNGKENSVARLDDQRGKLEDIRSNRKTESKGEQTQKKEQY